MFQLFSQERRIYMASDGGISALSGLFSPFLPIALYFFSFLREIRLAGWCVDMLQWVTAIQNAQTRLLGARIQHAVSGPLGQMPRAEQLPPANDKLKKVMLSSGNTHCADCGARGTSTAFTTALPALWQMCAL
jgi:hypothetical protein